MSSDSYRSYGSSSESYRNRYSEDVETRRREEDARRRRLDDAKALQEEKRERPRVSTEELYDERLVQLGITKVSQETKRAHVVLVDNSGSNRQIAKHLRNSATYMANGFNMIDPESQVCFIYFSDHGDGARLMQEIDFVSPGEKAAKILHSTGMNIHDADGADEPEAIECVLWRACEIDFNQATEKCLYLVTDVVAHGMGMTGDHGCPKKRDWRKSVERVKKHFTTFEVIGCAAAADIGEFQRKFLDADRVPWDHIDLSNINDYRHRLALVGNALLFLVARHRGSQAVEMFLGFLYEKWLKDPVFGGQTDARAQAQIKSFCQYLDIQSTEREAMLKKIFG